MLTTLYLILEVLVVLVPVLLGVAFIRSPLINPNIGLLYLMNILLFAILYKYGHISNFILSYFVDLMQNYSFVGSDQVYLLLFSSVLVKLNQNSDSFNPWFLTGFTDGEGSFTFSIVKSNTTKTGWAVLIGYNLVAKNNPANLAMLNSIQSFLGVGQIVAFDNHIRFIVNGLPNCIIIRYFFISYPLLSYKLVHFQIWCAVIDLFSAKEHLSLPGLLKLIALKAHSPNGLSPLLVKAFPNYSPIVCPAYSPDFSLLNIFWLAGFINADGSFGLYTQVKSPESPESVIFRFRILITQHVRSLPLIEAIKAFLGLGNIYVNDKSIAEFKIFNITKVTAFIALFSEAQLLGAKALDYSDFCKGINLIQSNAHHTSEGLSAYGLLISGMNSTRTFFGDTTTAKYGYHFALNETNKP